MLADRLPYARLREAPKGNELAAGANRLGQRAEPLGHEDDDGGRRPGRGRDKRAPGPPAARRRAVALPRAAQERSRSRSRTSFAIASGSRVASIVTILSGKRSASLR